MFEFTRPTCSSNFSNDFAVCVFLASFAFCILQEKKNQTSKNQIHKNIVIGHSNIIIVVVVVDRSSVNFGHFLAVSWDWYHRISYGVVERLKIFI